MVLSMDRWVGKVAVVTGASAGIGAAIARRLVEEGLQVVGLARRLDRVEELSKKLKGKKGKLHAYKTDMTKEADIVAAFKWISGNVGPVHILINNAGGTHATNLTDGDAEKWRKTFDVNVIGLSIATREAVRNMRANNVDGHIVHLNSVLGHNLMTTASMNVYPASKWAVTSLTETLRQELNQLKTKIKITSVSPGAVRTEFLDASGMKIPKEMLEKIAFLQPEDIEDSIIYALSTPPHVQVHELIVMPVGQ